VVIGNASTDTMNLISTISGFNNFSGFTAEIRMYAGNAAGDAPPAGWLYCNGDTISSTSANGGTHYNLDGKGNDYQPLFNKLKESSDWGNSSAATWGTNTVKTPDFRSRSPVGVHTGAATSITAGLTSRTLSDAVGTETHTLVIAELASHTHVMTNPSSLTGTTISNPTHTHTVPSGTSGTTTPGAGGTPSNNTTSTHSGHSHTISGVTAYTGATTYGKLTLVEYGVAQLNTSTNLSGSHSHNMSSHTHTGAAHTHTTPGSTTSATATLQALTDPQHSHTSEAATTGSGTAHTILSPIIAVNYIIKV
jgi:microcystin-dependent protein